MTVTDPTQDSQKISGQGTSGTKGGEASNDIYRIRVKPDVPYVMAYGEKKPLEAGMAVEADIAIDSRRLYQWIFDPVISMRDSFMNVSGGIRD